MPADLNSAAADLPAPTPGAPRPQEVAIPVRRKTPCWAAPHSPAARRITAGDQAFVAQAGPPAPADIRQQISALAAKDAKSQTLSNRMDPFGIPVAKPAIVDAKLETQRLQRNAALGLSPAKGSTPIVKPKHNNGPLGNWLESIF